MIKKLISIYNDLNMRNKLFITYLFLIMIPFIGFILINSRVTSKDLENQALYSSRQVFEQGRSYLENKISSVNTYMNVVSMNDTVQDIIKKDPKVYTDNYGLWGFDLNQISKQFFNSNPSTDIKKTRLYLDGSITAVAETEDFLSLSQAYKTGWYKNLISKSNASEWFSDVVTASWTKDEALKCISAVRRLPNNDNIRQMLGIVRVDIPESIFATLLDHVAYFKSSSIFLINSDNQIVCTSLSTKTADISFAPRIISKYSTFDLKSGVWNKQNINGKIYLVGLQSVAGTDWDMAITIPYNEILSIQSKTIEQMVFIFLIISFLTLPLAFFVAASSSKRIRGLISNMTSVKKGDFNISILSGSKDEIGELTRNFNSMVTKIAILLDEKYKLGQEIKSIELKALQAQINPHFLYNTLDLIYWKAMRIKENSISGLVLSLSKFYKLSLSKGNDIITLENEIEHVKAYVQIQNARYKNKIEFIIDIPEILLRQKVPKITLQPIVENSIIHGILEKHNEKGTIKITGYVENDKAILLVVDDGVGISDEKLTTLLYKDSEDAFHGYGINNINKRIQLLYGEQYGLTYFSEQGSGTTVKIILPIVLGGNL